MQQNPPKPAPAKLDDLVEAYESAQASCGTANLAEFLPAPGDSLYPAVLCELIRVDMEYAWRRGRPRQVEHYLQSFPELAKDTAALGEIAFEDFRLRQQAGERLPRSEYQQRYGIDTGSWPLFEAPAATDQTAVAADAPLPAEHPASDDLVAAARSFSAHVQKHGPADLHAWSFPNSVAHAQMFRELNGANPAAAQRLAQAATAFPDVGTEFLGFSLVALLGKGAFGRVYLARQPDLAGRLVALKLSANLWGESQILARLQHTHIVPIYSVHRSGPFQAVCMPYLGRTTLADVIRDLAGQVTPPRSGKALLSTLDSRAWFTTTQVDDQKRSDGMVGSRLTIGSASAKSSGEWAPDPFLARLAEKSYVDAVLWIGACLADGLGHAHERGIWHRDLKPANVLVTDDGQPMLLDFNLSEDRSLGGGASAAFIGGTLPYMPPEHLEALDNGKGAVDGRGDIYALGVILFELLAGRLPFPTHRGAMAEVLARMRADRCAAPPSLRPWNAQVSPAAEAVVRRCLEPEPARRYQSARQLEQDLKRHLENRPLLHTREPSLRERGRKWVRRHPRLASGLAAGALGAILLATVGTLYGVHAYQASRLEAANAVLESAATFREFRSEMRLAQERLLGSSGDPVQRARALEHSAVTLGRYLVMDDPAWQQTPAVRCLPAADREALRDDVAELLLLAARSTVDGGEADGRAPALTLNRKAEACFPADQVPGIVWLQRAALLGSGAEADALRTKAANTPLASARDRILLASEKMQLGKYHEALPLLEEALRTEPQRFTIWLDLALCHDALDRNADARACYSTCIALAPRLAPLYVKRGMTYLRLAQFASARADFDRATELQPDLAEAYLQRALALANLSPPQASAALRDLKHAQSLGAATGRALLIQAKVRERMGDRDGARADRIEGLKETPGDVASWLARGSAHLQQKEPRAALADFEQALLLAPHSLAALQNKAYILAEDPDKVGEAIGVLDQLIQSHPDYAQAWASRGVLLARQGKCAAALRDAEEALIHNPQPAILYQVAGIYALTSVTEPDDRLRALHLLARALRNGYGFELLDGDSDLSPIRDSAEFKRLVDGARALRPPDKKR